MEPQENKKLIKPTPQETGGIHQIRTFKSDVEDAIKGGVSGTTIVLAEQKKRQHEVRDMREKPPLSSFYVTSIIATIMLVLGGLVFFSLYFFIPKNKTEKPVLVAPKLIVAEFEKEINVDGIDRVKLVSILTTQRDSSFLQAGSILHTYFTKGTEAAKTNVTAKEFLRLLNTSAPAPLIRSLEDAFMYGFHGWGSNQPFLILKTSSYETSFSGMLEWEKSMTKELGPLFIIEEKKQIPLTGTSTPQSLGGKGLATTSATTTKNETAPSQFFDVILKNKDARVLKNKDGSIIFLYSFIDNHTIVMTTNETTLKELIARLYTASLVH